MNGETTTPLSEVDPRSIDEIFASDPLSITQVDLDAMVLYYRRNRAAWAKEESEAQAEGRRRRPKAYKETPESGKLKLSELKLDLKAGESK